MKREFKITHTEMIYTSGPMELALLVNARAKAVGLDLDKPHKRVTDMETGVTTYSQELDTFYERVLRWLRSKF